MGRIICLLVMVLGLLGCEVMPQWQSKIEHEQACVLDLQDDRISHVCDIGYWVNYSLQHTDLSWSQRREQIAALTDSPTDKLKKILLSQSAQAPYQARLRAQFWTEELLPQMTEPMHSFVTLFVYQPSQHQLELESALVTLNKLNVAHKQQLTELQAQLAQQRQQLEALMQLESNLVEEQQESNNDE